MYIANGLRRSTITAHGIYGFFGEFRFLSNFEAATIVLAEDEPGLAYPSSEHAYMAQKSTQQEQRRFIAALPTAQDAKFYGQGMPLRAGWDTYKPHAMLLVLRAKFNQNPLLRQKLINTGHLYLEETNNWGDTYWGVCDGVGLNMLGKTLMQVRAELQDGRNAITATTQFALQG